MTLTNGKRHLLIDGYTFYKHSCNKAGVIRYQCTSNRKCKAYAKVCQDTILKLVLEHMHPRTRYKQLSTGEYLRIY